jgi:hypothetical protein
MIWRLAELGYSALKRQWNLKYFKYVTSAFLLCGLVLSWLVFVPVEHALTSSDSRGGPDLVENPD